MGVFNEIFHSTKADSLERQGRYEEAADHALIGGGEGWQKKDRAARLLHKGRFYQKAIRYYKESLNEYPYSKTWHNYIHLVECYEALGEYDEAFELYFKEFARSSEFYLIYKKYREYCIRCPSLRLSKPRLREVYAGIYREPWGRSNYLSKEEQVQLIEDMEKEGLIEEAVDALKKSCPGGFDVVQNPEEAHFRIAELYKKGGDFTRAAEIYEVFNLIDQAAKCYERSGNIDKFALFLLANGRKSEAIALYERTGRSAKVRWVTEVSKFNLASFEHPLRQIKDLSAERKDEIFHKIKDSFNFHSERIRAGYLNFVREVMNDQLHSIITDQRWFYGPLLPIELECLYRIDGKQQKAEEVAKATAGFRQRTRALEGDRWYYDKKALEGVNAYLVGGEFFKGILVGENTLRILRKDNSHIFIMVHEI